MTTRSTYDLRTHRDNELRSLAVLREKLEDALVRYPDVTLDAGIKLLERKVPAPEVQLLRRQIAEAESAIEQWESRIASE